MAGKYSDCYFCGGEVLAQRIDREIWWLGKLHLVQGVPAGVCRQCGQKVILPDVAKAIDRILEGKVAPERILQVPSFRYPESRAM
ncbi:MAG: YgiT-type zinc finger protein [Planctomycetes bacterium]|nr:YgiT-type zinc finger protein [Planctomycetota bacterium]